MKEILKAIEDYILKMTKIQSSQLNSVVMNLEGLESDLNSLIIDVKDIIEGRNIR